MGQKANPISLRLHVNRDFESSWYQDKQYSNLLKQELQIRQYIKSLFYFMKIYEGRTLFQFFPKKLVIYSFITNKQFSSKKHENPRGLERRLQTGVVQNEKNFEIRLNTKRIEKNSKEATVEASDQKETKRSTRQEAILLIMRYVLELKRCKNSKLSKLHYPLFLYFISRFSQLTISNFSQKSQISSLQTLKHLQTEKKINSKRKSQFISHSFYDSVIPQLNKSTQCISNIFPLKLHSKYQSASFLAQHIAECFEKNLGFRQIFKQVQKDILKDKNILGLKIQCSGRIQGAEIAKVESKKMGQTSLHTFSASVDFARAEAYTLYGIIGIKVWVSCVQ